MTATPEELAAFADGELDDARRAEIERIAASDPAVAAAIDRHRALRAKLSAHYAPILDQPVPEGLTGALGANKVSANKVSANKEGATKVVDFAAARAAKAERAPARSWAWIAGPALAASLVLALFIARSPVPGGPDGYVGGQLASALDSQLAAGQADNADTRIVLSFRDRNDRFCRAYTHGVDGGIACKDNTGWQLRETVSGTVRSGSDYRQAGNGHGELMEKAAAMARGEALDASEEARARDAGWR